MDNRRVYKKRSNQRRDKNLFSKVKNFFLSSIWNNSDAKQPITTGGELKLDTNSDGTPSFKDSNGLQSNAETGTIPSTPRSNNIGYSVNNGGERTPNVLLSEFFQKKGNQPLTAVEYEGVMSLISQSQTKPNNGIRSPMMPGTFSRYDTPAPASSKQSRQNHDNLHNTSMIESTPSKQQALRNTSESKESSPKVFATPEYRPVYHNITGSARKSGVSSVKRVYQFSGLPSPYRTRIRAPAMSPKRIKGSGETSLVLSSEQAIRSKPMNKTASTLLSVLDDSKKNNNYILQFSNPYMGSSSVSKRHGNLTADAINSTIMFDQSTDLPDSMSNNSSVTTPAADSVTNNDSNNNIATTGSNNGISEAPVQSSSSKTNHFSVSTSSNQKLDLEAASLPNPIESSDVNNGASSGLKNVVASNLNSTSGETTESSSTKSSDNKGLTSFPSSQSKPTQSGQSVAEKSVPAQKPTPFSFSNLGADSATSTAPVPAPTTENSSKSFNAASNAGSNTGSFGSKNGGLSSSMNGNLFGSSDTTVGGVSAANTGDDNVSRKVSNGSAAVSNGSKPFEFPQVEVQRVNLDQSKVDSLKHLFAFDV